MMFHREVTTALKALELSGGVKRYMSAVVLIGSKCNHKDLAPVDVHCFSEKCDRLTMAFVFLTK